MLHTKLSGDNEMQENYMQIISYIKLGK